MNNVRLSEDEVREAVTTYFTQKEFTVDTECDIQFGAGKGRNHGIADVVVKNPEGYWVAIVECKSERIGRTIEGEWQLKSYLSATDTRFGILASSKDPDDWLYFENLRSNVFMIRNKSDFDESKRDKYDRLLGYVYRASDGIFVNREIIREGYGRVDTRYPFKHEDTFMDYQSRAKADRKGLWRSSFRK